MTSAGPGLAAGRGRGGAVGGTDTQVGGLPGGPEQVLNDSNVDCQHCWEILLSQTLAPAPAPASISALPAADSPVATDARQSYF